MSRRQRADGTWTFTTEEHDARWYWPIGTRLTVTGHANLGAGIVTKENSTTVWAEFAAVGRKYKVAKLALVRVGGAR